jgi:hypothetical protein
MRYSPPLFAWSRGLPNFSDCPSPARCGAMAERARSLSSFGENVGRIRSALGMTQQRVAKEADLDPTYISGHRTRYAQPDDVRYVGSVTKRTCPDF